MEEVDFVGNGTRTVRCTNPGKFSRLFWEICFGDRIRACHQLVWVYFTHFLLGSDGSLSLLFPALRYRFSQGVVGRGERDVEQFHP